MQFYLYNSKSEKEFKFRSNQSLFLCFAEISIAHPLAYQLTDNLMSPTNIDMDLLLNQAMINQKESANLGNMHFLTSGVT